MVYEVVKASIKPMLNPELTASWEKGLNLVSEGSIVKTEYLQKLEDFITRQTESVKLLNNHFSLEYMFSLVDKCY